METVFWNWKDVNLQERKPSRFNFNLSSKMYCNAVFAGWVPSFRTRPSYAVAGMLAITKLSVDRLGGLSQIDAVQARRAPEVRGKIFCSTFRAQDRGKKMRGVCQHRPGRLVDVRLVLPLLFSLAAPALADDPPRAAPGLLTVAEGSPAAPTLKLGALDGSTIVPGTDGEVSVVHFFATWCEPCRDELPELVRFAARVPRVHIVLVDVGEVGVRVRRYLEGLPQGTPFAPDKVGLDMDRGAARAFGVSLLPSTLVVAGGHVVLRREGEVDWANPETLRSITATAFARGDGKPASAARARDASSDATQDLTRDLRQVQALNDPPAKPEDQPKDQPGGTVR